LKTLLTSSKNSLFCPSDMLKIRSLFKSTAIYGAGDLFNKVVGFLLIPLYTSYLTPQEYGVYNMLFLYSALAGIVVLLGTNVAFFRFFVNFGETERKKVFSSILFFITITSAIFLLATYILRDPLASLLLGDSSLSHLIILMSLATVAGAYLTILLVVDMAKKNAKAFIIYNGIKMLTNIALNVVFVIYLSLGVAGTMYAFLLSNLLTSLVVIPRRRSYLSFEFSWEKIGKILSYGLPIVPTLLAIFVFNMSDKLLIKLFLGLEDVGIYSLGYKLGSLVFLVVNAFQYAWTPFMYEAGTSEKAKEMYSRISRIYLSLGLLGALVLNLFTSEAFHLFVGEEYLRAEWIVLPISLAFILDGMAMIFQVGIYLKDRTKYMPLIALSAGITNILLNIILIPTTGLAGAVCATVASYFVYMIVSLVVSNRFLYVRYPWGRFALYFIGFAIIYTGKFILQPAGIWNIAWKGALILFFIIYIIRLDPPAGLLPTLEKKGIL